MSMKLENARATIGERSRIWRLPVALPGSLETFGVARQPAFAVDYGHGDNTMSLGTILLIILVIALLGGFSGIGGGRFYGTGYYGGGGLGLVIVILLVLLLLGKI